MSAVFCQLYIKLMQLLIPRMTLASLSAIRVQNENDFESGISVSRFLRTGTCRMHACIRPIMTGKSVFSAICNIYISRLCYDVCVRLSVCPSVCDGSALAHYS